MPYDPKTINKGATEISASGWNSFVRLYDDYYKSPGSFIENSPILRSSTIVDVVLDEGAEAIKPYQPCRIVKSGKFMQETGSMWFVVEPVDRVDEEGNPTERHGNYAFTLAEGVTEKGGRAVINGLAIVTVTRDQVADGTEVANNYLGTPFDGYDGKYESSYYVVPDGSIVDDDKTVIAPIGHFKLVSWYDPEEVKAQYGLLDDDLLFVVDMNQRFTSISVETFGTIVGYSGYYNDQTYNQGYVFIERPLEGVPEEIDDVLPRAGNNRSGQECTPSIKNGESNYFRSLATNTHLYDISPGTHVITYSRTLNRMIFTGDPLHNDGRINAWYYSLSNDERVSRGRSSGFYISNNGWGSFNGDNADTTPYPTYLYTSPETFSSGKIMLASDYMTDGGNDPDVNWRDQGVPSHMPDDIVPAIVLMLDEDHGYATYCDEKCPEEGVLVSAPFGEFKIIDNQPLHNESSSSTYPQWNRCLGYLKNEHAMSGVMHLGNATSTAYETDKYSIRINKDNKTGASSLPECLPEIETTYYATNIDSLIRANHVDNMPQPQYQCTVDYMIRLDLSNNETHQAGDLTLYSYGGVHELKAIGVKADGSEVELDKSIWAAPEFVGTSSTCNQMAVFKLAFFWEEIYKNVYLSLETDATPNDSFSGSVTLHRRQNLGADPDNSSGLVTQPEDLTLPEWPTYPNGDIESAGIFWGYTR